ncbi:MAG: riboflavin synthase subunit alpha [Deltaproteobacteria bacterium RIFOXYD12_FULL_57_12]|nr:MAG: riboflavin synthase subunit alpha [Deltaproteobacteria bacterium RIFOXYD12_FULL_57_12]
MFTGIIQGKGRIIESRPAGGGMVFVLEADFDLVDPEEGESIAVNGVCLTAKAIAGRRFAVDVSPESLARTTLGRLAHGKTVNLERALRLSDRLGGHLVSGHVDGVASVLDVRPEGDFVRYTFGIPANLAKYIIEKGSIAVNGISLTVNSCDAQVFAVAIIPHTLKITTMGSLKKGASVNIEVDLIGKYVEKLLAVKHEPGQVAESRLNPAFLAAHGYIR